MLSYKCVFAPTEHRFISTEYYIYSVLFSTSVTAFFFSHFAFSEHEAWSLHSSPSHSYDVKAVWEGREGACMEC